MATGQGKVREICKLVREILNTKKIGENSGNFIILAQNMYCRRYFDYLKCEKKKVLIFSPACFACSKVWKLVNFRTFCAKKLFKDFICFIYRIKLGHFSVRASKGNLSFIGCEKTSHLSPLTLEVVGAPEMMLQQYLFILSCLPLPSWNLQTSLPSIPWCYLPISACIPLLLAPFTVPCRIVFAMPEDLEMWLYHLSFHFFTMVRSSCTPIAFWVLLRTSSFITWALEEMSRNLLYHLISRAWILLFISAVKVQFSQA